MEKSSALGVEIFIELRKVCSGCYNIHLSLLKVCSGHSKVFIWATLSVLWMLLNVHLSYFKCALSVVISHLSCVKWSFECWKYPLSYFLKCALNVCNIPFELLLKLCSECWNTHWATWSVLWLCEKKLKKIHWALLKCALGEGFFLSFPHFWAA